MEVVAGYSYSGPAADGIEIIELAAEEDAVCGVHLGSMERIAESWHAIHTEVVAGRQDGGMIRAVLFDLDGVIRHFDHDTTLEARHGLADGAIARTAFSSPLIDEVTTGLLTREEWIIRVGEAAGSAAAAQEWGRTPFAADRDVLALVDAVRSHGTTCAILTNGTDTIDEELRDSGIDAHFDRVFNSADIGHAKPDVRAFRHVVAALDLPPEEVFFLDDSPGKLSGARALGMTTHHFTGVAALRTALHVAGVPGATAPTPIP
ncbi:MULTISPECIES: HAD family hydrolase [unclassified Microbacterium]|uniref:HAD family hydrolase n=1 Tax=unclassified Microbacterium TaxID=2609290 RepID=UPI0021086F64|nr:MULTISPECIES: HAD family phosphatase [unclassified Microbacterium]